MLASKIKSREKLDPVVGRNSFVLKCFGCREVYFPEGEINKYLDEKNPKAVKRLDYLCREEFTAAYLENSKKWIEQSENIIVFSCGAGVQAVAAALEESEVLPGCDTFHIRGFQGLTAAGSDCVQCSECRLSYTGGICPLTACSKSLIYGPCGGASGGKCEVDREMDCGWELIYKRIEKQQRPEILKKEQEPRDYGKMLSENKSSGEKSQ